MGRISGCVPLGDAFPAPATRPYTTTYGSLPYCCRAINSATRMARQGMARQGPALGWRGLLVTQLLKRWEETITD
jgi:hypothetical protein